MIKNAVLRNKVKRNKKILMKAIQTAWFLKEEFSINNESTPNELFYGTNRNPKVRPKHFIQWGEWFSLITNEIILRSIQIAVHL